MLKVKTGQKGRPKNDVKDSTQIQVFFNFLSSQIESDDIPPEVNNTELGKPIKVLKYEPRFCLNCLSACILSGKMRKNPNVQYVKRIR